MLGFSLVVAETAGRARQMLSSTATRKSGPITMFTPMASLHKAALLSPWSLIKSNNHDIPSVNLLILYLKRIKHYFLYSQGNCFLFFLFFFFKIFLLLKLFIDRNDDGYNMHKVLFACATRNFVNQ